MRTAKLLDKKSIYFGGIVGLVTILLYDIIGSIIAGGYSQIIQAVRRLTQVGVENFYLLSSLFSIVGLILVVFAIELDNYKFDQKKLLFLGGIILSSLGILFLSGIIFPMVPLNGGITFEVVILIIVTSLFGICLYIEKKWESFRRYSIVTVLIMGTFGGLTSLLIMNSIELLGLFERIIIYVYYFWIIILVVSLINKKKVIK